MALRAGRVPHPTFKFIPAPLCRCVRNKKKTNNEFCQPTIIIVTNLFYVLMTAMVFCQTDRSSSLFAVAGSLNAAVIMTFSLKKQLSGFSVILLRYYSVKFQRYSSRLNQ